MPEKAAGKLPEKDQELSVAEQNKGAQVLFEKIFEVVDNNERKDVLLQIEAMYRDIVNTYPKAPLAQESFWRLILIYLNDYNPPLFDKLETTYGQFIERYPQSPFRDEIERDIAKSLFFHKQWDRIIRFTTPAVKAFISSGKLGNPREMLLYSEAKLNLGDTEDAARGFKIVIVNFPKTPEAIRAAQLLDAVTAKAKQK